MSAEGQARPHLHNQITGENRVSQDQLRDFNKAIESIRPFMRDASDDISDVPPGVLYYCHHLLDGEDYAEVFLITGGFNTSPPPDSEHGIITNEHFESESGKKTLTKRRYNTSTYGRGADEHNEPSESEEHFIEDEEGNFTRQVDPVTLKDQEAKELKTRGDIKGTEEAKAAFYDSINQIIELEAITGVGKYQLASFMDFMSIVRRIQRDLGIDFTSN